MPWFLKSGQLITGKTGLIYKGKDGTGRIIKPDEYATISQLNELKTSVSNGKSAVASAITDKGVSTSATASFNTMANNIRSISTGPNVSVISGSVLYGSGRYYYQQYPSYTPPLFKIDYGLVIGYVKFNGYSRITGSCLASTSPWYYQLYNVKTGALYTIRSTSSMTGTIPDSAKDGNPYIVIVYCGNNVSADNILQVNLE